jgi:hypothetical protein
VSTFDLTPEDARMKYNNALRLACKHGHLEIARYLTSTFGLTAADARMRGNYAFRCSCQNGHLETAQWLVMTFGLTVADARAINAYEPRQMGVYPAVDDWLMETFGL